MAHTQHPDLHRSGKEHSPGPVPPGNKPKMGGPPRKQDSDMPDLDKFAAKLGTARDDGSDNRRGTAEDGAVTGRRPSFVASAVAALLLGAAAVGVIRKLTGDDPEDARWYHRFGFGG